MKRTVCSRVLVNLSLYVALNMLAINVLMAQVKYLPPHIKNSDSKLLEDSKNLNENGWIELKNNVVVDTSQFFERYAKGLGLESNKNITLKKVRETKESAQKNSSNFTHQHFQAYYKGIKIEGSEFSLHSQSGNVKTANGKIFSELEISVIPKLLLKEAYESVSKNISLYSSKTDVEKLENELIIARANIEDYSLSSFRLAYSFDIVTSKPFDVYNVFVDAITGEVLKKISKTKQCFHYEHTGQKTDYKDLVFKTKASKPLFNANFIPRYSRYLNGQSTLNFETGGPSSSGQQILHASSTYNGNTNPAATWTKRYVNGDIFDAILLGSSIFGKNSQEFSWAGIPEVENPSSNWGTTQREATTAHWIAQKTNEFFSTKYGRFGPANNGRVARILTNVPQGEPHGFMGPKHWGSFGHFDGWDLITIQSFAGESFETIDVLVHEITHGLTLYTSNLVYERESGALNESVSDIFGTCIERHLLPNSWNWLIGEDVGIGLQLRNMANPPSPANPILPIRGQVAQPDTYQGPFWHNTQTNAQDHYGVHTNSGVLNKWFWLICTGGVFNGRTVQAIPFDHAEHIVFKAFTEYVQSQDGYAEARNATIEAARVLYGDCSAEHRQVIEAWGAVNLAITSPCGADCNFTIQPTATNASCGSTITLSVNCTGSGCAGLTYSWIGAGIDGTRPGQTITVTAPSSPGEYSYGVFTSKPGCELQTALVNSIVSCSPSLPNGCYTIKAKHSNKFIQPENGNGGARLRQYDANGQTNQIFNFEVVDGTAYRINSQSAGKVVEAANAGTGNATPVVLGDWNGGNHQKWNLEAWGDGTYKLSPKNASGQLFDVEGTSVDNGAGIHLWGQHSGNNQRFFVQASGCTGGPVDPPGSCSLTSIRIYPRKECCPGRTLGGQIQYSTVGQNGPWITAYTISNENTNTYTSYSFTAVSSVKAVRYRSPDGGYGNVAEIEFYNGVTKLDGGFFHDGSGPWNGQADRTADKAVDGNPDTFYDSVNDNGSFVGFVLSGCGGGCSAPVPGITGGGNVCNGGTVTLTASGCSGIYHWSNGTNGSSQITVGAAGPYSVTCEQGGCTSGPSATVTVTANCGGGGCPVVDRVRLIFRDPNSSASDLARLDGAKIQGSIDQSTWTDLYTFSSSGTGLWQEASFGNSVAYAHVRFVASGSGYGELHELEFYQGSTRLMGSGFGTNGTNSSDDYQAALDGNPATRWHGTFPGPASNYAGLHLSGCGGGGRQAAGEAFAVEPTEPKGLQLVPNPASDFVELRLPAGERVRRVQGYDLQGRVVCESEQTRLFVGRLPGGTYLIRVETSTGTVYSKMLLKP